MEPDAAPAWQRPRKRGGGERRRKRAAEAAIATACADACGDGGAATAASSQVVTEAEGVKLILSDRNSTGYHNVRPERSRYRTYNYENGKQKHIGTFDTAVEAALAYARHVGSLRAPAPPPPPVEAEAPPRPARPIFYCSRRRRRRAPLRRRRALPAPGGTAPHVRAAARSCCQLEPTAALPVRTAGDRRGGARCRRRRRAVGQGGGGGGRLRQVPQLSPTSAFGGPGLKRKRCSAPTEGEEAGAEAGEAAEVVRLHLEGQPTLCVGW